ncbi:hypothetical protein AK812_SmicGene36037 [Symbiodinium microadriaticum]|uniref:Uncharacterized protein n=1 Tax=Symbiodinium microadriaticum TaxID=2951 RepID=A0A1Q9CJZ1_SYMMI|nr:hypothetical protein AK812_SmicGene36037 [Symbiodinium microadriaticum]
MAASAGSTDGAGCGWTTTGVWTSLAMAFGCACSCPAQRGDSVGEEVVDDNMQKINDEAARILAAERQEVEMWWKLRRAQSPTENEAQELFMTKEAAAVMESIQAEQVPVPDTLPEAGEAVEAAEAQLEKAVQEQRDKERNDSVATFLKKHGFKDVGQAKKSLLSGTTYPLHKACKLGDARMVAYLLEAGASLEQKDSHGKTAVDIAKASRNTSVLKELGCETSAARGGGAGSGEWRFPAREVQARPGRQSDERESRVRQERRVRGDGCGASPVILRRRKDEVAKVVGSDGRIRLRGVASVSDVTRYCKDIDPYSRKNWAVREAFKSMRTEEQKRMATQTWSALKNWRSSEKPLEEWYAEVRCRQPAVVDGRSELN